MAEHDDAHLAKAYLQRLMEAWPADGKLRRPARDWRFAAIAFLALGSCAGDGSYNDTPDAEEFDAGSDALADVPADMSSDEPTSIAMYAAPGCEVSRERAEGSTGLWFLAAAAGLGLRRKKVRKRG